MSINYVPEQIRLSQLIANATHNASLVIPDLQRPYIWEPKQVIYLVDSLFRGWPFGTLLLWEVRSDIFSATEGIPFRAFWQVVDRVAKEGIANSTSAPPTTYQMVLDGQQRIQSILLALGGDQWGFVLKDHKWAWETQDKDINETSNWSKASLCLDLVEFVNEVKRKGNKARNIEVFKVLNWVVIDHTKDQYPLDKKNHYIQRVVDYPGRFIRLSRLWDLADVYKSEDEYKEDIEKILNDHHVTLPNDELIKFLSEFMPIMYNVKNNTVIHALKINSFAKTAQWTKDDYGDAIVNIFTRLNTAGRALTKEEITFAWIKRGWDDSKTLKKSASLCMEELQEEFKKNNLLKVEIDDLVRLISFIWSINENNGKILDSNELLKGDKVRPMANYISENWLTINANIISALTLINTRELSENIESFNSVIVFIAWYTIVYQFLNKFDGMKVPERDSLEKEIALIAKTFLDRWIFSSMWSKVWADSSAQSFQNFAYDLKSINEALKNCDKTNFTSTVSTSVTTILARISDKAILHVNTFNVYDRRKVSMYYYILWIWHRLYKTRWDRSTISLRIGRTRLKWELDHIIADAWWKKKVEEEVQKKLPAFKGTDEEKEQLAPDGFDNKDEAIAFINILGNFSFLEKAFNISKSQKSLWSFLEQIHEFQNGIESRDDWEKSLLMNHTLTDPDSFTFADIVAAIKERDSLMRKELVQFINGTLTRQDLT